jgi:hypothetical protein
VESSVPPRGCRGGARAQEGRFISRVCADRKLKHDSEHTGNLDDRNGVAPKTQTGSTSTSSQTGAKDSMAARGENGEAMLLNGVVAMGLLTLIALRWFRAPVPNPGVASS